MHRDLRIVGAGLDADITAAAGRIQLLVAELGQFLQWWGQFVGNTESVHPVLAEERGAEADRQG
ncbi:Uncharacterised protein [Mycobacteroides abscessus subsp. massiliense]|nr:Uncharacterised protein [Mycobacteroides abscessus subsp. massiliense]